MIYKIGVFGSAVENNKKALVLAKKLGIEFGKRKNLILITGGSTGLPYMVANEASKKGVDIWGFTPEIDFQHHKMFFPENNPSIFTKLFYVPAYYKKLFFIRNNNQFKCEQFARLCYRNVISTANCDAAIIISGRWGTLNEFINLYEMGKIIGVLTETGGITDDLKTLITKVPKKTNAIVHFGPDPKKLISKVIDSLNKQNTSVKYLLAKKGVHSTKVI